VHTSNPDAYPLAGRKPRRDTPWSRQVLVRGEPYYANDAAGIRFAFEDAEKILGLGLGAVMNVPVKEGERVLGTLNFLREAGAYRPQDLQLAMKLAADARALLK
jgi:GAF domain-containing protein